jgi:hypothetical protein
MLENGGEILPSSSRSKGVAKPEARSRVSNGKDLFLDGVDGRSALARTQLAVWCEQAEADAAAGKALNIGEYATATNTLRRLLLDLGLERRMRDITPNIDAYLTKGGTA